MGTEPHRRTLSRLHAGEKAAVVSLGADGTQRRRMMDLGLTPGTVVQALYRSPAGDPVAYWIRGAVIALREEDANKVWVTSPD